MNAEAVSAALDTLFRDIPNDVVAPHEWEPVRKVLKDELRGHEVCDVSVMPTKGEPSSGLLALEEGRTALYRLMARPEEGAKEGPPLTLIRELLHLAGTAVRQEVRLDDDKTRISITLRDGRELTAESLDAETSRKLREELEERAR